MIKCEFYLPYIIHSIEKRYAVLCSYSNEVRDVGHAAIAVTVDDEAYMKVDFQLYNLAIM